MTATDAVYRRFFESTQVVYAGVVDRSGRIVVISNAALEGVGASADEVLGQPLWETRWFSHREDSQVAARRLIERALQGEVAQEDIWNRRADGEEVLVRASAEPGYGDDGEIREVLVSGFDDTARWHAVEKQALILREADHRMKNILTIIKAVARLSARTSETKEEFLLGFDHRLLSLAASHDLSLTGGRGVVEIGALVRAQLAPFADPEWSRIGLDGPNVLLPATQTQALGLVLHEFATNAIKFGCSLAPRGPCRDRLDGRRRGRFLDPSLDRERWAAGGVGATDRFWNRLRLSPSGTDVRRRLPGARISARGLSRASQNRRRRMKTQSAARRSVR